MSFLSNTVGGIELTDTSQLMNATAVADSDETSRNMSIHVDANRFHYQKLSKEQAQLVDNMSVDVYLEDELGKTRHKKHKFDQKKLQDKLISKIQPRKQGESDADYEYRIKHVTEEYERILQKMQTT